MGALAGLGAGSVVGGVAGAVVGLGIPEYEAKVYEGKLRSGNLLISVHTEDAQERARAEEVFKRMAVKDVSTTTEASVPRDERPGAPRNS